MDLLSQRPEIERYLCKRETFLSSFSFVNIFLWKDFFDFEFQKIEDHLCVFARNILGAFLYLPPLGETFSMKVLEKSFDVLKEKNNRSGVSRIENMETWHLENLRRDRYFVYKKTDEYLYLRKNIVYLRGNSFKAKRALYNFFVKRYRYEYLPFASEMTEECLELYDQWAREKTMKEADDVYRQMLEENRSVHRLGLESFRELDLIGRVVFVEDRIRAYTFGYKLNDMTFCVLFEIADLSVKGLPVFVFREFCCDSEVSGFRFINVMDDFGLENIRRTKRSFRPLAEIPSYVISEKDSNERF